MASKRTEELEQSRLPELHKVGSNAFKTPFLKGSPCLPCATGIVTPLSPCGCWQGGLRDGSCRSSRSRRIPEPAALLPALSPGGDGRGELTQAAPAPLDTCWSRAIYTP